MKSFLYAAVLLLCYYSVEGRSYGYGKKKVKSVPVPVLDTGVDNIGLDSWQNGRNWQDGGNWENSGIFNQRRNGGFVDNFQNLDLLGLGQRSGLGHRSRFNNRISGGNNWDIQNRQFGNQW